MVSQPSQVHRSTHLMHAVETVQVTDDHLNAQDLAHRVRTFPQTADDSLNVQEDANVQALREKVREALAQQQEPNSRNLGAPPGHMHPAVGSNSSPRKSAPTTMPR